MVDAAMWVDRTRVRLWPLKKTWVALNKKRDLVVFDKYPIDVDLLKVDPPVVTGIYFFFKDA
jgi:hypothetical protein